MGQGPDSEKQLASGSSAHDEMSGRQPPILLRRAAGPAFGRRRMVKLREMREESSRISLRSNPTHETPVALGSTPVAVALEPFAVLAKPVAVALTPLAKLESPGRGGFGAEGVGAGASRGIAVGDAAVAGPPRHVASLFLEPEHASRSGRATAPNLPPSSFAALAPAR